MFVPSHYVGVDIGGTNIVCGLVGMDGRLIRTSKLPTEAHLGSEAVLKKVAIMIKGILMDENMSLEHIVAVGIGTPGLVDPIQGVTLFAGNLRWNEVPVARNLSVQLGVPVYVDNDVRMYVYGEALTGAGQGYRNVLGITLGTGLAAAVVNHGQLYYGAHYMAGELGHLPIDEIPYTCPCGLQGCLETVASGTGIARQAREALSKGISSLMHELDPGKPTAATVSRAYDLGDPLAIEIMNRTGRLLGRGLAYAITLYNPDRLVIGGGVASAGDRLLNPMREEIRKSVYSGYWNNLTIQVAQHLEFAGVIGSALSAKQRESSKNN